MQNPDTHRIITSRRPFRPSSPGRRSRDGPRNHRRLRLRRRGGRRKLRGRQQLRDPLPHRPRPTPAPTSSRPPCRTTSRRRSPEPTAPPARRSRLAAPTCPSASPSPSPTRWHSPAARSTGTPRAPPCTTTGCARHARTTSSAYRTTSASSTAPTAKWCPTGNSTAWAPPSRPPPSPARCATPTRWRACRSSSPSTESRPPNDTQRAAFIPAAVRELAAEIAAGTPVLGYCHWTLMDNFEWIFGYGAQLGLHEVDRATFQRHPKPSARAYADVVRDYRGTAAH
ncbi:family 1 glycosylhydrolase [Streptomyces sp. NPDC007189]|uniref:family 1 glycosylhydrolase n=1 Tax=Streptomyces sp. NPDC007189 TaxID=3154315 RepID=UPI003452A9B6